MKNNSGHDDHMQTLSDAEYDKLMKSLNEQLDSLWAEIEQSEVYAEHLKDDDQGPVD